MTRFRVATFKDVPALHALVNSAYRGESSKQGWTTEADLLDGQRTDEDSLAAMIADTDSVLLLVEEGEGEILACVHLKKMDRTSYLGMLTVSPRLQNKGTGRKLLEQAEQYVQNTWGSESVHMTVVSVRDTLIDWYRRRGYTETGERRPFPMQDPRFGLPKAPLEFIVMSKHFGG